MRHVRSSLPGSRRVSVSSGFLKSLAAACPCRSRWRSWLTLRPSYLSRCVPYIVSSTRQMPPPLTAVKELQFRPHTCTQWP